MENCPIVALTYDFFSQKNYFNSEILRTFALKNKTNIVKLTYTTVYEKKDCSRQLENEYDAE